MSKLLNQKYCLKNYVNRNSRMSPLFDESVMENIRLGRSGASDEDVRAAAKAPNVMSLLIVYRKAMTRISGKTEVIIRWRAPAHFYCPCLAKKCSCYSSR